ncbi:MULTISPECIES: FAD-dependent urate hydroxylase HpxO [unclassified Halomonas]|uniref:FAD-dependent urate hydroxylase HpxO n=1 Tax=unclassified Halomonas TaxID=2609666 RepID=UPI0020A1ADB8|nr:MULTISPECIES: FAD-dependent urate hydroxylase HpxO [unclassified Halomonas]MCP1315660.1 FAD-dependent urate hydroxylase HpxO [Halomonas sp. 707D7]MCP1327538.1 FAD-dependent urate hydroxylase HpxO [Halomonas sp. 707D4]
MALDIVVIGAGMGGLSAALALKARGHRVKVFERVEVMRPVGAAISLWPNGVKVMHALGLGTTIERVSGEMTRMRYLSRDGQPLSDFSLVPLYEAVNQRACPISRAALQQTLFDAVGAEHIHLGRHCVDYTTGIDKVVATFEDGERVEADLLVVADGTHSKLRDTLVGRRVERQYVGYVNWNVRVTADAALAPLESWDQYVGEGKRVSLMPMGVGGNDAGEQEFYCFFDVPLPAGTPSAPARYRDELKEHFAGWSAPVQALIERFDPARMARVEIHDIEPLSRLTDTRVALLGDAAHAMAPDLGQGGCQAMEDAWVLAEALTSALAEQAEPDAALARALARYDEARVKRVGEIVRRARSRAAMIHGENAAETQAWYEELGREQGVGVRAGIEKTIRGGPLA